MEFPIVSAATAAILLAVQQVLLLNTGTYRATAKVGVGDGGNPDMLRLSRRHGNLAENAAIFIVTLGFLELLAGSGGAVPWLAAAFLLVRASHIVAFSSNAGSHGGGSGGRIFMRLRMLGAVGTAIVGVVTAGVLIYRIIAM